MLQKLLTFLMLIALALPVTAQQSGTDQIDYVELTEPFTTNYMGGDGRLHFLQIQVTLMTRGEIARQTVYDNKPLVRNQLAFFLFGQSEDVLRQSGSKEILRKQALAEVRQLLTKETGLAYGVEEILFTRFIIQ
ncbi:flagellar basal body-associated FliL family protein [Pelagibaculum spongiae]|nr:flagellar basal body-associated FliL family protein [Pelagibaculum spongiae]